MTARHQTAGLSHAAPGGSAAGHAAPGAPVAFEEWAGAELARAWQILREDGGEPAAGSAGVPANRVAALHAIAHNIKGAGSSFGYPLLTEIGQSLCCFLRGLEQAGSRHLGARPLLEAHLQALQTVLQHRIAGAGGPLGSELLERLRALTDRALPRP